MRRNVVVVPAVLLLSTLAFAAPPSLKLARTELAPQQEVVVTFTAPDGLPEGAWIGLIPSAVPHGSEQTNDQNDVAYEYLNGQTSGSFTFTAPGLAGSYDLRMNDGQGKEIASVTFAVKIGDLSAASLRVSPTTVAPSALLEVAFTAPEGLPDNAWVGIIPSEIPHGSADVNDQHDIAYEYLDRRSSGTITFGAPGTPGSYDVRMQDTSEHGREIASATFTVRALVGATVEVDRQEYAPGEEMTIRFTTPAGMSERAWIGIVPSSVPHGDEETNDRNDVGYAYLEGWTSGAVTINAPLEGGSYDARLNDTDDHGREVASTGFVVTSDVSAEQMAAALKTKGKLALYGIHFATDDASITRESAKELAQVGQLLIRDASLRLTIEGHTDSTGKPEHNLDLSRRRADSVKTYLVETFGIDAGRLSTRGLGATVPVGDNATEAGRALNRRVELVRQE